MLKICKDCEHEIQGCSNCNPTCPVCGGEVKKVDLVTYRQMQENKKDGNKDS